MKGETSNDLEKCMYIVRPPLKVAQKLHCSALKLDVDAVKTKVQNVC